jgi:hypothetical protein
MKMMSKQGVVLLAAGTMVSPMLTAQNVWQKMKQAAQQAQRNAQAKQAERPTAAANTARPASGAPAAAVAAPVQPVADLSSPAMTELYRKLDVGGVWLGMPADAAQAAIKQRAPALLVEPHRFGFSDLPQTTLTDTIVFRPQRDDLSTEERIRLGLTMQPMQPAALSVFRHTRYDEKNAPTLANTVAALRAKYGHESVATSRDAVHETVYIWIFDATGRQVTPALRDNVVQWCGMNDVESPLPSVKSGYGATQSFDCSPYTVLRATLEEWSSRRTNRVGQEMPPGLLFQMDVMSISNPLLKSSSDATRQMLVTARAERQQKEKSAAGKNVPVL